MPSSVAAHIRRPGGSAAGRLGGQAQWAVGHENEHGTCPGFAGFRDQILPGYVSNSSVVRSQARSLEKRTEIVALVTSFVPFVGVVAWPLLILGLIFGEVGVAKARDGASPHGKAIAGLAGSGVALVVCLGWVAFVAELGSKSTVFPESFGQSPSRNQTVAFG